MRFVPAITSNVVKSIIKTNLQFGQWDNVYFFVDEVLSESCILEYIKFCAEYI